MMKNPVSACLILILAMGCSFPNHIERAYLAQVRSEGNYFTIPESGFDSVWRRANSFIDVYCTRPIISYSNDTIKTEQPCVFCNGAGYWIIAQRSRDSIEVNVYMRRGFWTDLFRINDNAYILTHFMRTGDLPYPELILK